MASRAWSWIKRVWNVLHQVSLVVWLWSLGAGAVVAAALRFLTSLGWEWYVLSGGIVMLMTGTLLYRREARKGIDRPQLRDEETALTREQEHVEVATPAPAPEPARESEEPGPGLAPAMSPLKRRLMNELTRGEELKRRIYDPLSGSLGGLTGLTATEEDVANWEDGVEGTLSQLPNGTRKVARFRTEPPESPFGGVTALAESPLKRRVEHHLTVLADIIEEID